MSFKITNIGPMSTIQDGGRKGFLSYGFSPNGIIDWKAHAHINILLDNDYETAVIESNFMGVSGEFLCATIFCLGGADCNPKLNDQPINMYQAYYAKEGDVLTSSFCQDGMRTYLGFHGGFDLTPVMGSLSTNLKCGIGGLNGTVLKKDDVIPLKSHDPKLYYMQSRRIKSAYVGADDYIIRVVLGPQDDYFTPQGLETFLNSKYTLTNDCDRMGLKLSGAAIQAKNGYDIISDGIPFGAIQVPTSGQPIVMLSDRQTTGGYAKIAVAAYVDLPKLASLKPNDVISFEKISLDEAAALYKEEQSKLEALRRLWTI